MSLEILINTAYHGTYMVSDKVDELYLERTGEKYKDTDRTSEDIIAIFKELGSDKFGAGDFTNIQITTIDAIYEFFHKIESITGDEHVIILKAEYDLHMLRTNINSILESGLSAEEKLSEIASLPGLDEA